MLTGGCLCGAVRYEIDGEALGGALCHCRTCQQAHAAPMVAFFSTPLTGFRLSGELTGFASSAEVTRRFCPKCGTHVLFDDSRLPAEIDVPTATLDRPEAAPPRYHIWTRSRPPWTKLDEGIPAYPERRDE